MDNEPVLLEKSSKKGGFIKPNIVEPKYKSIAKTLENHPEVNLNSDSPNLSTSDNYNNADHREHENENGLDQESYTFSSTNSSSNRERSIDTLGKKPIPGYKDVEYIEQGNIFTVKTKEGKKNKTSIKEEKSRKKEKNIIESSEKLKVPVDNDLKEEGNDSHIYFADNDLDFVLNKRIRESNQLNNNSFTRRSLLNKTKSLNKNNGENSKHDNNSEVGSSSEWRSKAIFLIDELKRKVLENPKDFDFYFKDSLFELKQELIKEKVIEVSSFHLDNEMNNDLQRLKKLNKMEELEKKEKETIEEMDKKSDSHHSDSVNRPYHKILTEIKREDKIEKMTHDPHQIINNSRNTEMKKKEIQHIQKTSKPLNQNKNLREAIHEQEALLENLKKSDAQNKRSFVKVDRINLEFESHPQLLRDKTIETQNKGGSQKKEEHKTFELEKTAKAKHDENISIKNISIEEEKSDRSNNNINKAPSHSFVFKQHSNTSRNEVDSKSLLSDLLNSLD